ncbi:MAG TPA: ABC transporter permease [Longimicrobiales bacterium]|nr:ABC transporter permease [Longimicrobiales bacterium]
MRLVLALYRVGLLLLPPSFRRAYGPELVGEAEDMLREARGSTKVSAALRLLGDGLRTLVREWVDALRSFARAGAWRGGVGAEIAVAARSLRRAPVFTATVALTLALGTGVTTVAFGLVDAYLLRALPYPEADRLVVLWPEQNWSRAMVDDAAAPALPGVEAVAAVGATNLILREGAEPREVLALEATTNLHALLGTTPVLGRSLVPEDARPGAEPVALISHGLWRDTFGADPGVLGRRIELGGEGAARRTVVGVMPADHEPIRFGNAVTAWIPVVMDPADGDWDDSYFLTALGRLAPGVSADDVSDGLRRWAGTQREAKPGWFSEEEVEAATVASWADHLRRDDRAPLLVALGAALLILLVASANVANLMLARVLRRERELSVRAALGAGAGRRAVVVGAEIAVLAALGGLGGLLVARSLGGGLGRLFPTLFPEGALALSLRTALAAGGVVLASALVAGFLPGLHAARQAPGRALSGGRGVRSGRGVIRAQSGLSAVQLALATAGIAVAALLGRSLLALDRVDPGFAADETVTFRITAPLYSRPGDDDVVAYFREVRQALLEVPGVIQAGFGSRLPMGGGQSIVTAYPEGWEVEEGQPAPSVWHRLVTPGYLEALGTRLVAGRIPDPAQDRDGEPLLVVINQSAAQRFWPDQPAVGKTFLGPGGVVYLTVAAVVGDVMETGPQGRVEPGLYIPHRDWPWRAMHAVVRVRDARGDLLPTLKDAVWSVAPGVPVSRVATLAGMADRSVRPTRLLTVLAAVTAGFTLLLGALGVYGVVSHAVANRVRELGVRAALGATGTRLVQEEIRRAASILVPGLGLGLFAAWIAGRGIRSLLFGVAPFDAPALTVAAGILVAVGLLAAWLPARRAARVDPATVLQSE